MEFDLVALKERAKASWSEGNYPEVARLLEPAAAELVAAAAISAGMTVLDVAAGNGNVAIRAAREGAGVVASDLTPTLIEAGRVRSQAEGVDIEWIEADAEDLPFGDRSFDCVTSAFGAMFAPRPERVASELFRVLRPGGTVGMASWTPESFSGQLFALNSRYLPPPEGIPPAVEWGVEATVRSRFGIHASSIEAQRRSVPFAFESLEAIGSFFSRNAGGQVAARKALPAERFQAMQEEAAQLVRDFNRASDGSVRIDAEYLLVVARKPG